MRPELQTDIDEASRTTDSKDICFDVLNASRSITLQFRDFKPERCFARKNGDTSKLKGFPPLEIHVPPGHMATIPDEWYRGKTKCGSVNTEAFHVVGPKRPLRNLRRSFRNGKLITTVMTPASWLAVPMSELAWAEVEEIRADRARKK